MADSLGRDYEPTTDDPYSAKNARLKRIFATPAHHELSNRKIGVLARVSEKMVRLYRKRMKLKVPVTKSPGRPRKTVEEKSPAAGRRRGL